MTALMLEKFRAFARSLKSEIAVLAYAVRDPRTPWYAKAFGVLVIAYALSPIDLIPDFIPIIGFIDDLILLPIGLWAVRRMIPPGVLAEHRTRVVPGTRLKPNRAAALVIVALWGLALIFLGGWLWDRGLRTWILAR